MTQIVNACSFDIMRDTQGVLRTDFPHSLFCVAGTQVGGFFHTLGLLWKEICIVVCFSCKVYDGLILYYQRAVEVPVIF
jgi:hypothetical protein